MGSRSSRWWPAVKTHLGTTADILSVASIGGLIVVAAIGVIAREPMAGLIVAFALSVLLNVALSVAYARSRSKTRIQGQSVDKARESNQPRETAVQPRSKPQKPAPVNDWIGRPGDLATLKVTNVDLDTAVQACIELAKVRLADDVEVRFNALRLIDSLGDPSTPVVWFEAYSPAAARAALLVYSGLGRTAEVNHVKRADEPDFMSAEAAPWQKDASWTRLVSLSWVRMRPFTGDAALFYTRYNNHWTVDYEPRKEGEHLPTVTFRLDEAGGLNPG